MLMLGELGVPEGLNDASEMVHAKCEGLCSPFHRLVFYCVAIKREVFDKIGLLDEVFSPGNCEDDDFCLRAIDAGFKLGIAQDCLIYHAGSATFGKHNPEYATLLLKNKTKLMEMWPEKRYAEMIEKNKQNCSVIPKQKKKTLALVMVVKNEALGLERAILSAKNFVDQIVIAVDNSSTDGTLEIARKYATTLKTFDWNDDFSQARNFAHANIVSDYFLFLDGHEYVTKCENLEMMLQSPADGLLCTVVLENGAEIRNPRIYRNGLHFEGAVHEIQNSKSLSVYSDFVVTHGRLGGQADEAIKIRDVQRNDQLNRIMGKQLSDDPADTRAAFHLALHKQSLGDFKGALKLQKLYFKTAKAKGERWYVYFNKVLCHFALGNYLCALWACTDAEKECPNKWEIAKLRGLIHFHNKNYTRAVKYFVDSFDENTGDVSYKPLVRDDADIWNKIGECYFNLQNYDCASDAFFEAHKLETNGVKKKLYYDRGKLMKDILRQE
jgi:glycosyltransferase involved in cell wall biosynthesis